MVYVRNIKIKDVFCVLSFYKVPIRLVLFGASSPLFFAEIRHVDQIQLRNSSSPAQKSSKKTFKMITSR
jgi:hypothetical protein